MTGARAFMRNASAVTSAEFALVVPAFLILVFGTINTGLAMSAVNQIHYAAERSARCLSVDVAGTCTKANIDGYAKGLYHGPGLTGLTFSSPATDPACGRRVTGTGSYAIFGGLESFSFTVTATACYPLI